MRFKRKAPRRKFAELLVKGEISPDAYERWNRDTGRAELPERVKPTGKRRKKAGRTKTGAKAKARRPPKSPRKSRRKPSRRLSVDQNLLAAKVPTDITEDTVRAVALPLGYVDVKVCAVTDVWSGLKLVMRKELR